MVSAIPSKDGFGGSLEDATGCPKVNSEGTACLGASPLAKPLLKDACDVDPGTSPDGVIALAKSPPKSGDGAIGSTLGNVSAVGASKSECPATSTLAGFLVETSGTLDKSGDWFADGISAVSTLLSLLSPNPRRGDDLVGDLKNSPPSFSPSHNGFSASFTGALGVGVWEGPILDVELEVIVTSEADNAGMAEWGTSSGFVNANELAKKTGTLLSLPSTGAESAFGAKDGSIAESSPDELDRRSSTTGAANDGAATGSKGATCEGARTTVSAGEDDKFDSCVCCESSVCDTGGVAFGLVKENGNEVIGGSFALVELCSMGIA